MRKYTADYHEGYRDACKTVINELKDCGIEAGSIASNGLDGILARLEYNHDAADYYVAQLNKDKEKADE